MEPIDFVKQHRPFDRLSAAEIAEVESALEAVRYPAGAAILEQGSPSRHLYLIREGTAQLSRDGDVVQLLERGEPFGERSLLAQEPSHFDIAAAEDTLVYRIPEGVFRRLMQNPSFAAFFLQGLGERLRRTRSLEVSRVGEDLGTPVGALVTAAPLFLAPEATVADAARAMHEARASAVLVRGEPPGIVTDRDLRSRVLAEGLTSDTAVRAVMSLPLTTFPADNPLYGALLLMLQEGVHHLPLTRGGRIVGVATDMDLLRHQAKSPLLLLKRIESLEQPEALSGYSLEVAEMAEGLFTGGVEPTQIARFIASINDALTTRLRALAEAELGEPPCPYAWMALGSEGRMEQVVLSDQDNALAYVDDAPAAQAYFEGLAERVVGGLLQAGFPRCPGGFMATNWHRPLAAWKKLFRGWIEHPRPRDLLRGEVFLDFRRVDGGLALDSLDEVLLSGGRRGPFLPYLARAALEFRPPLGFLGRIRPDDGQVNLKRGGIAAIASLARVYALEARAPVRPTLERLEAAAEAGTLSRGGAEVLAESFRFLVRMRLREQLRALRAGAEPSNKLRLATLSALESRHLKEAFRAIQEVQEATRLRFHTERLS
jgi:CBS domain-containing protein